MSDFFAALDARIARYDLLQHPFRRVDPDDVAAEPPRQQLGEAQIEDQRSSTGNHVVCQQFLPQPRRRR